VAGAVGREPAPDPDATDPAAGAELRVLRIELQLLRDELATSRAELERSREQMLDLNERAPVSYVTIDEAGVILEANLRAGSTFSLDLPAAPAPGARR